MIDRPIHHPFRESAIQQINLAIPVVAAQREARDAVEIRIPNNELLALVMITIVPDARTQVMSEESGV